MIQFTAHFYNEIDDAASLFGINHLMGQTWLTSSVTSLFCNHMLWFCELLESFFASSDPKYDDPDRFKVYIDHEPNGAPTRSLLHYA